ncbi:hypothetical protein HK405_005525 [Cladochytrium tenue]|nr:hypothetical protein HK405_005525 [Cladochytrium tenue]
MPATTTATTRSSNTTAAFTVAIATVAVAAAAIVAAKPTLAILVFPVFSVALALLVLVAIIAPSRDVLMCVPG